MTTSDPEEFADIEGALRTWLRADTDIQAVVDQRVFFGAPRKVTETGTYPMILVTRVGGGDDGAEAPLDRAMIQFDIYGRKADAGGSRLEVTNISTVLRKVLAKIRGRTRLDDHVVAFDTRTTVVLYSPLPGDDRPRVILTAIVPNIKLDLVP